MFVSLLAAHQCASSLLADLLNVDRYALYYFLGKAMQVLGDRKQAAGWFLEAYKNAQTKERQIEAVTEYAGDFLHCRKPDDAREYAEKTIELLRETKEKCGDPDGNLGSSLGMLYLVWSFCFMRSHSLVIPRLIVVLHPKAIGDAQAAEEVLQRCAAETGAPLAQGLMSYLPSAKAGGSKKWRWEKNGNRLYVSKDDEQNSSQQQREPINS